MSQKIQDWVGPLYTVVNLVRPMANFATTTAGVPSPTDAITGGLKAVMQLTKSVPDLQRRAIRLLTRMGMKARILQKYNWALYENELDLQVPILMLYKDIVIFCCEVDLYFGSRSENRIKKFKNKISMIFLDKFSEKLLKYVEAFEDDVEQLQEAVSAIQLRQQQTIAKNQQFQMRQEDRFQRHVLQNLNQTESYLLESRQASEEAKRQKARKAERQLYSSCLTWLSSLDFHELYRDRCDSHLTGTGEWFLDSSRYKDWRDSDESSLLWIQGKPGSGKSILAAVIITDLNNIINPDIGVAYALCQRSRQDVQTMAALLKSMIKQLSTQRGELHPKVLEAYNQSGFGKTLERDQIVDLLAEVVSSFDEVYLVLDALDENPEFERLLTALLELTEGERRSKRCLKVLILNRPLSRIERLLSPQYTPIRPEEQNKHDIDRYIETHLPNPEDVQARELCSQKANGMFMWVRLVFENSGGWLSGPEDIIDAIDSLPEGLNQVYDIVFEEISAQPNRLRQRAWHVLRWILKGYIRLNLKSIQAAIADYDNVKQLSQIDTRYTAEDVMELCKHLICPDQYGYFSFIHESVRLYLDQANPQSMVLKQFQDAGQAAHDKMATTCLRYLQLKEFDHPIPSSIDELAALTEENQFRHYAGSHWGRHASEGDYSQHKNLIIQFLSSPTRREFSIQVLNRQQSNDPFWYFPGSSSALQAIVMFDLPLLLKDVFKLDRCLYHADGSGKTPLRYALDHSNEDTVLSCLDLILSAKDPCLTWDDARSTLLRASFQGWIDVLSKLHKIDPQFLDRPLNEEGFTAMGIACSLKDDSATRMLLKLGASLSIPAQNGGVPLLTAIVSGRVDTALLLLESGADPNVQTLAGHTTLECAADLGQDRLVEALLQHGADINLKDTLDGYTAAHRAAYSNSPSSLDIMARLRPEFDFNAKDKYGRTPLHLTAFHDATWAAEKLLILGCKISATDLRGKTALHTAVKQGAIETVKMLLLHGGSVDTSDAEGNTAIHLAAFYSQAAILKILFDWSPKDHWPQLVGQHNRDGFPPLHLACKAGSEQSIRLLIDNGADCNAKDVLGNFPLHQAVSNGHSKLIPLLIPLTRDISIQNDYGNTPLHLAAMSSDKECVQQMLDNADRPSILQSVSLFNSVNRTPLFASLVRSADRRERWDSAISRLLLPLTPETTFRTKDADGDEILHCAAEQGDVSLVRDILAYDHDRTMVSTKGYIGCIPIMCAIIRRQFDTFQCLLPVSLSHLEERNDNGDTALLAAMSYDSAEIAKCLMDHGVNLNVVNNWNHGPLHYAANFNDENVFERLLSMGCRKFQASDTGTTPYHIAASSGSVKMIQLLKDYGFEDVNALNEHGSNAGICAMELALPSMIHELKRQGVRFDIPNGRGHGATHYAASNGHFDTLKDLERTGVDIYAASPDGATPFLMAANQGYTEIVKYLLEGNPSIISDRELWSGESALHAAATSRCTSTIKVLLDAGMNPYEADNFGYTAQDLMSTPFNNGQQTFVIDISTRKELLRDVIRKCLRELRLHQNVSIVRFDDLLGGQYFNLGRVLRLYGDFQASMLCFYPWFFADAYDYRACDGCKTIMIDEVLVCRSCYFNQFLCRLCYEDYISANRSMPTALQALFRLEERVMTVREACRQMTDIRDVAKAMNYFSYTNDFIATTLASYEQWIQDNYADIRYPDLPVFGREWLRLVQEFSELQTMDIPMVERTRVEHSKRIDAIRKRYEILLGKQRLGRECAKFPCNGHIYERMTRSEYDRLKSDSDLYDTETGFPREMLLDRILVRLSTDQVDAGQLQTSFRDTSTISSNNEKNPNVSKFDIISVMKRDYRPSNASPMRMVHQKNPRSDNVQNQRKMYTVVTAPDATKESLTEGSRKDRTNPTATHGTENTSISPARRFDFLIGDLYELGRLLRAQLRTNGKGDGQDELERLIKAKGGQDYARRRRSLKLLKILETIEEPLVYTIGHALNIGEALHAGFINGYIEKEYAQRFEQKS